MAISIQRARDFIYSNGVLWERALFAYLFQGGRIEHLHQCLACYKNPDGGFGHALEHDIRTPDSHPLALEYILGVFAQFDLPAGTLFDEAAAWVESQRREDGSLKNPESVLDYPHAPWWGDENSPLYGGQSAPDSITGNLKRLGKASPALLEGTKQWAQAKLTIEKIKANEWLFMAYHAYDYFFNVDDFPDLQRHRQATIDNIIACARAAPENQYASIFRFATSPGSPVAKTLPDNLIERALDHLLDSQQDDGSWHDQHGLAQWYPMTTVSALWALQQYGKL